MNEVFDVEKYVNSLNIENEEQKKYSWPFFPYKGSNYGKSNGRKIMFVGKATYGWGPKKSNLNEYLKIQHPVEKSKRDTIEFIENDIKYYYCGCPGFPESYKGNNTIKKTGKKRPYQSSFWRRIYTISISLLENKFIPYNLNELNPEMADKVFSSIYWTNVFKIGSVEGNPDSKLIKKLESIEREHEFLLQEIRALNPDVVIFSTGTSYDRHLKLILDIDEIDSNENMVELKIRGYDGYAIRTKHFQALKNKDLVTLIDIIKG